MSDHLAVATVTAALCEFIGRNLPPDLGVNVTPGRPPAEPPAEATITVFCYQTTPNAALRNRDAPIRAADGTLLNRPQAAIDLHYLISFYGPETELVPQRLLGSVLRALYEEPVLSRQDIENAIAARPYLAGADLAAARDRVRFTPALVDIDDLYKLWTMMSQTPFALSLMYQASVVVIDGRRTPRPGRPVEERDIRVRPVDRPVGRAAP